MALAGEIEVLIKSEVANAIKNLKKYNTSLGSSKSQIRQFADEANKLGRNMTKWFTLPIAAAGTAGLKFAADIETQKTAFGVLLQDVEKGAELFEQLKEFSAETPLQLEDITQGTQTLLAFGVASEDVQEKLSNIGDLAQGNASKMQRLTEAYGKLRAKGVATLEELNRFTENGVPLLDALASQFNTTTDTILEMVSQGKIGFEDVDIAIQSLTGAGGQFENMMETISKTTTGKFSTAVDNLKLSLADLVSDLLPMINDLLDSITGLAQRFTGLDDNTKNWILTIGAVLALEGPLLSMISSVTKAIIALATGALAGPQGIIILVGMAVAAITALILKLKVFKTETENVAMEVKSASESIEDMTRTKRLERLAEEIAIAEERVAELKNTYDQCRESIEQFKDSAVLSEVFEQDISDAIAELEALRKKYADLQGEIETSNLTGIQKRFTEIHNELLEAFRIAEEKAEAFGDAALEKAEKRAAVEEAINTLLEDEEYKFTAAGAAVQSILNNYGEWLKDATDAAEKYVIPTSRVTEELEEQKDLILEQRRMWLTLPGLKNDLADLNERLALGEYNNLDALMLQIEAMQKLIKEYETLLGITDSAESESGGSIAVQTITAATRSGEILADAIATGISDGFDAFDFAQAGIDIASEIVSSVGAVLEAAGEGSHWGVKLAGAILSLVGGIIEAVSAAIEASREEDWAAFLESDFGKVFTRLNESIEALENAASDFGDMLVEASGSLDDFKDSFDDYITDLARESIYALYEDQINEILSGLMIGMGEISGDLELIWGDLEDVFEEIVDAFEEAGVGFDDSTDEVEAAIERVEEAIDDEYDIRQDALDDLEDMFDEELYAIKNLYEKGAISWEDYTERVDALNAALETKKEAITATSDEIVSQLEALITALEDGTIDPDQIEWALSGVSTAIEDGYDSIIEDGVFSVTGDFTELTEAITSSIESMLERAEYELPDVSTGAIDTTYGYTAEELAAASEAGATPKSVTININAPVYGVDDLNQTLYQSTKKLTSTNILSGGSLL